MLFALGLGILLAISIANPLSWFTYAISLLFALVSIFAIYKDSKSPNASLGQFVILFALSWIIFKIVETQTSYLVGVLYLTALMLAVYSAWNLYLRSDRHNADN